MGKLRPEGPGLQAAGGAGQASAAGALSLAPTPQFTAFSWAPGP